MLTRVWLARLCGVMISASVLSPAPSLAFFGDATEWTQLLNNAELIGIADHRMYEAKALRTEQKRLQLVS